MQPSSTRESGLPADWPEVLEQIQQALTRTLAEAAASERALNDCFPPEDARSDSRAAGQPHREPVDEWLRRFQAGLQQAEGRAAEVDALLQAGQESVQQGMAAAASLGQRLSKWETPFIR